MKENKIKILHTVIKYPITIISTPIQLIAIALAYIALSLKSFANALIAISEFQFHNGTINTVFVTLTISEESVSIPQRYN